MLIGIWMLNSVYIMHIKLMDINIKNFITAKSLDFGIFENIIKYFYSINNNISEF